MSWCILFNRACVDCGACDKGPIYNRICINFFKCLTQNAIDSDYAVIKIGRIERPEIESKD